ncbi:Gfo/Idh/MocA family protein [Chelativorans alearense]|uniref:Gfo/Idh/MocA family protein n=1 Tax=Chelativorans alearense TaxID=2681495 RepID=UPI0013D01C86|nr:Gfo/Idh/MocA family oxidoreductase [Chelativorans alearense]
MHVGLIGVGHWHAHMHAKAAVSAGAQLGTVWDADRQVAESFAAQYGISASNEPQAVIGHSSLVVIMGRPDSVPPLAEMAIAAGVPVILEKPAAPDSAALAALARSASSAGVFVAVPLPNRLGPAMREYHRLATEARAGPIAHAHFRIINGPPQRYRDDGVAWMLDFAVSGGGALRNLGIHGIDCALSLAEGPVQIVCAQIGKSIHREEDVEDYALIVLVDANGAVFTIEAGYTFASMLPGGDFEWRIATANAYFIDHGDAALAVTLDDRCREPLPPLPPSERYTAFMIDTINRLAAGAPPLVGISDYARAMDLIDRAYEEALP